VVTGRAVWDRARTHTQEQKSYRAVLLAAPDLVPIVAHVVSTVGRVVETVPLTDGRQEVVALCDRLEAAAAMLAGPGERAEIVGPPELIAAILDVSRHNRARYDAG
jgi:hypothetical protein